MRRVGFTLIETLLAIALMIAVLSLVGPALLDRIAPATFEYTVEEFAAELRLAREDARRTGQMRLVYVVREASFTGEGTGQSGSYTGDAGTIDSVWAGDSAPVGEVRIESRLTPVSDAGDAFDGATDQTDFGGSGSRDFSGSSSGTVASSEGFGSVSADEIPRLLFTLPDGYDLVHRRPDFLNARDDFGSEPTAAVMAEIGGLEFDDGAMSAGSPDLITAASDAGKTTTLLAVCVPDGTVLLARSTWLVTPDARAARLRIDSASGFIRFETEDQSRSDELDGFDQLERPLTDPAGGGRNDLPIGGQP